MLYFAGRKNAREKRIIPDENPARRSVLNEDAGTRNVVVDGPGQRTTTGDWRLLLVLFVLFRIMALVFLRPGGYLLTDSVDFPFYRQIGEFSLSGYYPYLHYWFEYPPVFPWVVVGLYRLSVLLPPPVQDLFWFQVFVSSFLLACETGSLVLVHRLSRELWGEAQAFRSALIYASLFAPLFTMLNWFDSFALFFLLLATWLIVRRRYWLAGLASGIGFMVKIFPIIVAPAALRYFKNRGRLAFAVAAATAMLAVALPFVVFDSRWILASFRGMIARSSWETVWALLENYFSFGAMPSLSDRFNVDAAVWSSHPATLPWPIIDLAFLLSCVLVFIKRPTIPFPRAAVAAVALTLNLFLIFSKGYSPQFLVYPLALLVVLRPDGWGVAYATVLTAANLVEFPVYIDYFPEQHWILWSTVLLRTLIFGMLSLDYAMMLLNRAVPHWRPIERQLALPSAILLGGGVVLGAALLLQHSAQPDQQPAVVRYVRSQVAPSEVLLVSSRDAFYRLQPYFRDEPLVLGEWSDESEDALRQRLNAASAGKSQVLLILDHNGNEAITYWLLRWCNRWGIVQSDSWFDSLEVVKYVPHLAPSSTPSSP